MGMMPGGDLRSQKKVSNYANNITGSKLDARHLPYGWGPELSPQTLILYFELTPKRCMRPTNDRVHLVTNSFRDFRCKGGLESAHFLAPYVYPYQTQAQAQPYYRRSSCRERSDSVCGRPWPSRAGMT